MSGVGHCLRIPIRHVQDTYGPYASRQGRYLRVIILPSVDRVRGGVGRIARIRTLSIFSLNFHSIEPNRGSLLMNNTYSDRVP